ncbi:hypothetical protein [Bradyrhizobium sp. 62]|uniref:hypothetical protein n=1 Tax=Bradyrhizobium sp. 62 TaxID=1043588 RepID=UPI001FFB0710|nr:hypothetical protein [Bradyrhizobium sp. 62]MCK1366470.1 hypothetical protein [Bradyrhizobium sp. 62]
MAWEKIVKRIGVGCCPECQSLGFDYQEGANPHDDERAAVLCPNCGWKGMLGQMRIIPEPGTNGASQKMSDMKRTSLIALLVRLVGFTLGGAVLGFAAMLIGTSFLGGVQGGIHSDWTLVVLLGILVCFALGGVAGAKGATRLVKSWRS